jgi:hypothetical protein
MASRTPRRRPAAPPGPVQTPGHGATAVQQVLPASRIRGIVLVQVTTADHLTHRLANMWAAPELLGLLAVGVNVSLHGSKRWPTTGSSSGHAPQTPSGVASEGRSSSRSCWTRGSSVMMAVLPPAKVGSGRGRGLPARVLVAPCGVARGRGITRKQPPVESQPVFRRWEGFTGSHDGPEPYKPCYRFREGARAAPCGTVVGAPAPAEDDRGGGRSRYEASGFGTGGPPRAR